MLRFIMWTIHLLTGQNTAARNCQVWVGTCLGILMAVSAICGWPRLPLRGRRAGNAPSLVPSLVWDTGRYYDDLPHLVITIEAEDIRRHATGGPGQDKMAATIATTTTTVVVTQIVNNYYHHTTYINHGTID